MMDDGRATIGEIDLFHASRGQGDPILLIQGLSYDHRPYRWLADELSATRRTIVFDNRGVGDSSVPDGPYAIEQMAGDALGLIDHLGIDRVDVMGVSMGGYIAQTLALDHPDRVRALVLGCTFSSGDPGKLQMPASTLEMLLDREGTPEQIARRGLAVAFSDSFTETSPEIFETLVSWRVKNPITAAGYHAQFAAALGFDITSRIDRLTAPTLILHGDADDVVPVGRARQLHEAIPASRLEILAGAGHLFFIEKAEQTAMLIGRFLEQIAEGT